jgi:formylmethanofuran dehydrogenase subunit E
MDFDIAPVESEGKPPVLLSISCHGCGKFASHKTAVMWHNKIYCHKCGDAQHLPGVDK